MQAAMLIGGQAECQSVVVSEYFEVAVEYDFKAVVELYLVSVVFTGEFFDGVSRVFCLYVFKKFCRDSRFRDSVVFAIYVFPFAVSAELYFVTVFEFDIECCTCQFGLFDNVCDLM